MLSCCHEVSLYLTHLLIDKLVNEQLVLVSFLTESLRLNAKHDELIFQDTIPLLGLLVQLRSPSDLVYV